MEDVFEEVLEGLWKFGGGVTIPSCIYWSQKEAVFSLNLEANPDNLNITWQMLGQMNRVL